MLLVTGVYDITLTNLHLIYFYDEFNCIFYVNIGFRVCIFIFNYFECILVCLTAWEIFWMLVYDSFQGFVGGRRIKDFDGGEDDNMFL